MDTGITESKRRYSSLTNHFTSTDYWVMDPTCSMEYARLIDRSIDLKRKSVNESD